MLVAGNEITKVKLKYRWQRSEEKEEVEDSDSVSSGATTYLPVPQHCLGDNHDDNGLSHDYDKLATKNQCIPPR